MLVVYIISIFAALAVIASIGSCSPRIAESIKTEHSDSVKVVIRERIVKDTVGIEVPVEVEKLVTRDTISHIENSYAKSDAVVSNGFLFHSLESKPQIIRVPVEVLVADTSASHTQIITETKTVYKEKELSWLQKTQIYGFRCVLLIALLFLGWKYRKILWPIIKNIIKL